MRCVSILVFICCLYSTPSVADQQNLMNIRDLIVLGLEANLGLQLEGLEVAKNKESIKQEQSVFDSTFFATAGYERSSTPYDSSYSPSISESRAESLSGQVGLSKSFMTGLSTTVAFDSQWLSGNDSSENLDPRYRTALVLELNQPLLKNFGTAVNSTRLEISKSQQRQTALSYLLQAQNLILQLEVTARQLAAKVEIIQLRQQSLTLANDLYLANKKRFDAGIIAVTEIQEAETEVAARQLSLSLAIQEQNLLLEELNRQLDHRLTAKFNPESLIASPSSLGTFTVADNETLFDRALQQRLELKINNYVIQSSSLQHDYLRNQLQPQLDLKLQFGINGLAGKERASSLQSQYSGDWLNSFSSMSNADGYQWLAGVELTMPLGNRAAKSRYRQAELQLKQDRYRHKDLESMIKNDLLQQKINIFHTKEQLAITERFESLAKKALEQEQQRLQEGLSDTFRIIIFQQRMVAAKIDRINAITRYHLALAQMDYALGQTFERHNIVLRNNAEELTLEDI